MKLLLTGLNHKTAPVELRERLAVSPDRLSVETAALLEHEGVREAMIVSTCNRVEMLVAYEGPEPELPDFLQARYAVRRELVVPHLYEYREMDAARHLFRVAASLDSMVVGESQILGQVKESYAAAREAGAMGGNLERLLQGAFAAAKKVRTETQIGSSSVSIASVAVDLVRKIFGSLKGKRVLLVGAGKMSELAARHLMQQGASSLIISNRTHERAIRLADKFSAQVIRFEDIYARAHEADILITSTGAPEFLFSAPNAQQFLQRRKNRPMVFIDIAVPRDVDPEINRLEGAFVYDIDDLQQVAASNLVDREREAQMAETILDEEIDRYRSRLETLDVVPTLRELQGYAEQIRQGELRRAQARLQALTPDQMAAVEAVTRGLVNKFLHHPLQALKSAAREGDVTAIDAIRTAFHLGPTIDEPMARPADSASALHERLALQEDHD
ncbi:glutamyl-tRNA reductase [Silvibacterium sp.]|uniref:glutamyl-tRNA reductase n=1 Tax=Silvibacterium sp. TaxID=1964179 RepID=UPI0039E31D5E